MNTHCNSGYSGLLSLNCSLLIFFFSLVLLHSGHLAAISFSLFIQRSVFFSLAAVPPHIRSRGLSRLLTFLWPSLYYVETIRFIPTRFTNVTLTTLLSVCVCVFYGLDLAKSEWCLEANRGIPASESSINDFSFSALRPWKHGGCSFWMHALTRTHSLSLLYTHIYTWISEKKKETTFT